MALPATARAHEPFEITTDAHITRGAMEVHVTVAVRTAARLCLLDDADQRRLYAGAPGPVEFRITLEDCARRMYDVSSDGQALLPREARVFRTEEDDLDLRVVYPEPARGRLRFEATHLRHLSDPTYGATLTVTAPGAFLGQKVLRASDPTLAVLFAAPVVSAPPPPPPALRRYAIAAAATVAALVWALSRAFRRGRRSPATR